MNKYCVSSHHKPMDITHYYYNLTYDKVRYCCNVTFNSDFGYHFPLSLQKQHTISITLFRNPIERIISAYLFDSNGGMLPAGYPDRKASNVSIHAAILNSTCPICTYANLTAIKACQTKMLSNQWCGQMPNIALLPSSKEGMMKLLQSSQLIFGLTEEFAASVLLFHKQLQGSVSSSPIIPTNQVRKNPRHNSRSQAKLSAELISSGWEEPLDTLLYQTAKEMFCKKCQQYNIQTITCPTIM